MEKEERCECIFLDDAEVVLVAYGTMARIARTALNKLRDAGKKVGLIRPITLWPYPGKVFSKITKPSSAESSLRSQSRKPRVKLLVLEMSYGQMIEDVKLAVNGKIEVEFLGRSGGGIPSEEEIIKFVVRSLA